MDCLSAVLLILGLVIAVAFVAGQAKGSSRPAPAVPSRRTPSAHYSIRIDPLSLTEPEEDVDVASFWKKPGEAVTVWGHELTAGMLYVGPATPRERWGQPLEASFLDTSLAIDRHRPDTEGVNLHYWPTYHGLPPASRAAYVAWLAGGRKDPDTAIGYVFLFFYGIERRLVAERPGPDERDALLAEVERLLTIYGEQRSFCGYATGLLEIVRWRTGSVPDEPPCDVEDLDSGYRQPPLSLKIALGRTVKAGEPIAPDLALAWVANGPFRFRTAARRCAKEFGELFRIRYREVYPKGGLKLRPNKTKLEAHYHPASPSLRRFSLTQRHPDDLPDVAALTAPVAKLQSLVDDVTQELDTYSRYVGRTEDADSPAALALLPPELAGVRESAESLELFRWLDGHLQGVGRRPVPTADLLARWPTRTEGKMTKREAEAFAGFCASRGIGIEPDVRWGGPALHRTETAVLFGLPEAARDDEPSDAYASAALMLRLAAAVSAADGDVSAAEEAHLERHLEEGLELTPHERLRLQAHLAWLLADPPGLAGVKKAVEPLDPVTRHGIGQFLIAVAGADGHVDADELKILQKVYGLLGLDKDAVFSDVHGLMSGDGPAAVTAVTAAPTRPGVPRPAGEEPQGFRLDLDKVRRKRQETLEVGGLLHEIFADDAEPEPPPAAVPPPEDEGERVAGLDGPHSRLLLRLAEKPVWPRSEIEHLCAELDLLPDGALEMINEAAFEACGDPLLEGDEVVEVDPEILEEMLAEAGAT
jgi:tellurite resistance protein